MVFCYSYVQPGVQTHQKGPSAVSSKHECQPVKELLAQVLTGCHQSSSKLCILHHIIYFASSHARMCEVETCKKPKPDRAFKLSAAIIPPGNSDSSPTAFAKLPLHNSSQRHVPQALSAIWTGSVPPQPLFDILPNIYLQQNALHANGHSKHSSST